MQAEEAAKATRDVVSGLPANFMMDGNTYKRGGELGFDGIDFYVAGRGGVLGVCDADVVSAAFLYFNPERVRQGWEAGLEVMPPAASAAEFAACCHGWAEAHLGDDVDAARLAELAGRIVDAASPAGAPLFAGWRRLDVPESPKAAALHHLNALRELRGGLHGGAVLGAGLRPKEALALASPAMAPVFGWEDLPPTDGLQEAWDRGEAATNIAVGVAYSVLSEAELDEFTELAKGLAASAS